ncbi:DUF434 domain-containing protein [Thermococcus gorgonarius]|uniref:DUF434 domain-containing protein n=1 Tax=Thermococcus gorgonarius TaxID=71997 RepID=A0A2Z2MEE0_THEGO|nr:DUF434 domain-containing protein [Thermococcus gorgonarius]ASJ00831.1 hypothetical protein A3K92_04715 [Thermococcus gorgonarius]
MSLHEAYQDLKYLLNRGYRKKSALKFVADHYRLTLEERHLLARCVFSDSWIEEVRRKLLKPEELAGITLAIDGFNVLITMESILEGRAILCEDGLVRDLKYQGRYKLNENTERLLRETVRELGELGVGKAVFFYGRNVPKSGVVKALTEKSLEEFGVPGEVYLVKSPDFELKRFEAVATADVGIISKVSHVFDLPGHFARMFQKTVESFFDVVRR